jgi:hypothetical protein
MKCAGAATGEELLRSVVRLAAEPTPGTTMMARTNTAPMAAALRGRTRTMVPSPSDVEKLELNIERCVARRQVEEAGHNASTHTGSRSA